MFVFTLIITVFLRYFVTLLKDHTDFNTRAKFLVELDKFAGSFMLIVPFLK